MLNFLHFYIHLQIILFIIKIYKMVCIFYILSADNITHSCLARDLQIYGSMDPSAVLCSAKN
jgi:hypothetical protein